MDSIALEDVLGGGLYLLNKLFLDIMERRKSSVEAYWFWRKLAWIVYLLGLPPVLMIFYHEQDWLFGAVELGGTPAMFCGVIAAMSRKNAPAWLDRIALYAIPVGLAVTFLDFRDWHTFALQFLGSAGFLIGTYELSKDRQSGYNWFLLMNTATGALLYVQGRPFWLLQQILSIIFTFDARRVRRLKTANATA